MSIVQRKVLTPEQEAAEYKKALRADIRRFKQARAEWIENAKSHGASDEVAENCKPVQQLDRWIAEAQEALR